MTEFGNRPKIQLPNATAVLILGILSIVSCCCYGGGVILGIIALVLTSKDMRLFRADPDTFTLGSYNNLVAGRICAIIGIVFSVLSLMWYAYLLLVIGIDNMSNPDSMMDAIKSL